MTGISRGYGARQIAPFRVATLRIRSEDHPQRAAAGAILHYTGRRSEAREHLTGSVLRATRFVAARSGNAPQPGTDGTGLGADRNTTLLAALDECVTPSGARCSRAGCCAFHPKERNRSEMGVGGRVRRQTVAREEFGGFRQGPRPGAPSQQGHVGSANARDLLLARSLNCFDDSQNDGALASRLRKLTSASTN